MKIYITGCAKSGTTLLCRLFHSFENVKVIDQEISLDEFVRYDTERCVIAKRTIDTIFSSELKKEELIRQQGLIKTHEIKIINLVRDGRDVILSDNFYTRPRRWIESIKHINEYGTIISCNIKYEDLIVDPESIQRKIADIFGLVEKHKFSEYPSFVPSHVFESIYYIGFDMKKHTVNEQLYTPRNIDSNNTRKDHEEYKKICSKIELKEFEEGLKTINYNKKIIVIHEVTKAILDLPLEDYILTFDDALYSQYYYWPLIEKIKTEKIIFISPSLINETNEVREQFRGTHIQFPTCFEAMRLHKQQNDRSNYMTLNEIKDMKGVTIGAHSFSHFNELDMRLYNKVKFIKEDTKEMMGWFKEKLDLKPDAYAFPHYIENDFQRVILKSYGFKMFFGSEERQMVEQL